jgi:FkbM family methyltransferase
MLASIRRFFSDLRIRQRRSAFERRVATQYTGVCAGLKAGEVAIDCGANIGDMTALMAATGATVYAFEPNPAAFKVLSARFKEVANVHCLNQAVLDRRATVRLFEHVRATEDPVYWSNGSSILEFKGNVDKGRWAEVEAIDLAEFIRSLNQRVGVLKIDIEGAECEVLESLIGQNLHEMVDLILVETHDHKIAELRPRTEALRALVASRGLAHIRLDWD